MVDVRVIGFAVRTAVHLPGAGFRTGAMACVPAEICARTSAASAPNAGHSEGRCGRARIVGPYPAPMMSGCRAGLAAATGPATGSPQDRLDLTMRPAICRSASSPSSYTSADAEAVIQIEGQIP